VKALLLTNEYPPNVYGGAGVHVEFLSRELAKLVDVEVRCFGDQHVDEPRLKVRGYPEPSGMTAPDYLRPVFGAMGRDAAILGMTLFNASPEELAGIHAGIGAGLELGTLNPVVGRKFPLADAPKAHVAVMEPGALGKIVLIP